MSRTALLLAEPPDYLEVMVDDAIVLEEVDAEDGPLEDPTQVVCAPPRSRDDEPTLPFSFESAELCPDEKLIIGYLTMEAHGLFAELPMDEQERVATTLRR